MTFTQKATAAGIVPVFLEEATLSNGSRAVWMGDHWMMMGCK